MRKFILLTILTGLVAFGTNAQDSDLKLGIKVAPVFGNSRIQLDDPDVTVENDGAAFKLSLGLIVDKSFGDNYMLSTGLIYIPKEIGLAINPEASSTQTWNSTETYKLQYLQIPATVKLFTNEIQPDVKVYFQLGMALEIKVFEEADPELTEPEVIAQFQPMNIPVILGTGIEYRAGLNTVLFGGISYQRGLINIVKDTNYTFAEDFALRSTLVSIDIGIKF
ncbi:MAG: porin family protein [Cyclobacteriaceae bacterium]